MIKLRSGFLYSNVYLWFYSDDFCLWRGTLWRFRRKVKETKMTSRRKWNLFKRHLSFTFEEQIKPIWSVSIWNHQLQALFWNWINPSLIFTITHHFPISKRDYVLCPNIYQLTLRICHIHVDGKRLVKNVKVSMPTFPFHFKENFSSSGKTLNGRDSFILDNLAPQVFGLAKLQFFLVYTDNWYLLGVWQWNLNIEQWGNLWPTKIFSIILQSV